MIGPFKGKGLLYKRLTCAASTSSLMSLLESSFLLSIVSRIALRALGFVLHGSAGCGLAKDEVLGRRGERGGDMSACTARLVYR